MSQSIRAVKARAIHAPFGAGTKITLGIAPSPARKPYLVQNTQIGISYEP